MVNTSLSARVRRRNKQGFDGVGSHNAPIVPEGGYGNYRDYTGRQRLKGKNRKGEIIPIPTRQEFLYKEAEKICPYKHIGSKPIGRVRQAVSRVAKEYGKLRAKE